MPKSITKNTLDDDMISRLTMVGLGKELAEAKELTEGYFNSAYYVRTVDNCEYILKVAPADTVDIMQNEKNIMFSEVDSMRLISRMTSVPVPQIWCYDDTRTLLPANYFFMDKLPGASLSSVMDRWKEEEKENSAADAHAAEKDRIYNRLGQYNREINNITNSRFGYYAQPENQGTSWYEVFRHMIVMLIEDIDRKHVDIKISSDHILKLLDRDRHYFDEVTKPCLVHWDIWAGNVFVSRTPESGELYISGIIDFERCLWGDPLMEVGFRTYDLKKSFFDGYGIEKLSDKETVRAKWYDVYLFLISSMENAYRQYDNDWANSWATEMIRKWIDNELQGASV